MRAGRAGVVAGWLLLAAVSVGWAQTGAEGAADVAVAPAASVASVSFAFDRPGLPVPQFVLTVWEDGRGRYVADEAAQGGAAGVHVDRPLTVSAETRSKIFEAARAEKMFQVPCDAKIKHIADTGKKVLTYSGPDGSGSCTYNYSELKGVAMLTELFQGMALTMDEGRKLEFRKRFDRLGLDAELGVLIEAVQHKQAFEVGTISETLTRIAQDTDVMERARMRAVKLLEMAKSSE